MNINSAKPSGCFAKSKCWISLWLCRPCTKADTTNSMAQFSGCSGNKRKNWGKAGAGVAEDLQRIV